MSMIQCPECGREISDKAKACPHCGTPIFVCPECNNVSTGSEGVCPHCGYEHREKALVIQPTQVEVQTNVLEETENNDVIARWLKENPREQKWLKSKIVNILGFLLLAILAAVIISIVFAIQKPFESLHDNHNYLSVMDLMLNYQVYIRNTWILTSFGYVAIAIFTFLSIYQVMWDVRCAKWMRDKKIDIKESLIHEPDEFLSDPINNNKKRKYDNGCAVANTARAGVYFLALKRSSILQIMKVLSNFLFLGMFMGILTIYTVKVCHMIEVNTITYQKTKVTFFEDDIWIWVLFIVVLLIFSILVFTLRHVADNKIKNCIQEEIVK